MQPITTDVSQRDRSWWIGFLSPVRLIPGWVLLPPADQGTQHCFIYPLKDLHPPETGGAVVGRGDETTHFHHSQMQCCSQNKCMELMWGWDVLPCSLVPGGRAAGTSQYRRSKRKIVLCILMIWSQLLFIHWYWWLYKTFSSFYYPKLIN